MDGQNRKPVVDLVCPLPINPLGAGLTDTLLLHQPKHVRGGGLCA